MGHASQMIRSHYHGVNLPTALHKGLSILLIVQNKTSKEESCDSQLVTQGLLFYKMVSLVGLINPMVASLGLRLPALS